jgi:hypothetical protein
MPFTMISAAYFVSPKFKTKAFSPVVYGINLGQLVYAPYERDITSALTEGENTLEIHVQPLRSNRRVGLKEAYEADPEANAKYEYYSKTVGAAMGDAPTVMGGGIVGPLSLNIIE